MPFSFSRLSPPECLANRLTPPQGHLILKLLKLSPSYPHHVCLAFLRILECVATYFDRTGEQPLDVHIDMLSVHSDEDRGAWAKRAAKKAPELGQALAKSPFSRS